MNFLDARRYASKAFRIGGTQELIETGNSLAASKSSVGRMGAGFRSYVGLSFAQTLAVSKLLISLGVSAADDDEDDRVRENPGTKIP